MVEMRETVPDGKAAQRGQVVRWAIWGAGAVAHAVASDFPLAGGMALEAVASRTIDHARRFAARHKAARYYGDLESLLADDRVDVVYIATPNHRHADDCLACIRAGKAVLCEKPFALNHAQAQAVVEAARRGKVFCMEAMWTRFIPAVREAKRSIDAGELGGIRMIEGDFAYPVSPGTESRRFFDPDLGGGALLDRGVYLISLAQQFLGRPRAIRGTASIGASGVDEQSAYQLAFEGGALASLAASFRFRGANELIVFGERGSLRLREPFYRAHRLVSRPYAGPATGMREGSTPSAGAWRKMAGALRSSPSARMLQRRLSPLLAPLQRGRTRSFPFPGNGYQFQLQEVNRCVREGLLESAIMPLKDSLEVMETMDALRSEWGLVYPSEKTQGHKEC